VPNYFFSIFHVVRGFNVAAIRNYVKTKISAVYNCLSCNE